MWNSHLAGWLPACINWGGWSLRWQWNNCCRLNMTELIVTSVEFLARGMICIQDYGRIYITLNPNGPSGFHITSYSSCCKWLLYKGQQLQAILVLLFHCNCSISSFTFDCNWWPSENLPGRSGLRGMALGHTGYYPFWDRLTGGSLRNWIGDTGGISVARIIAINRSSTWWIFTCRPTQKFNIRCELRPIIIWMSKE